MMKMTSPTTASDPNDEFDSKIYSAGELKDDARCSHRFKRVSSYKVECSKCHVGLYDDPNSPVPIEALNEFYENPKNQAYNKWL
jgi:hypothetical protein